MINEEVKKWLIKALNDYKTAEKLINLPEEEVITDTLCFHCQQAVEKLLKTFLINAGVDFGRVHSLEYLIKLCSDLDDEFEGLYEITANLTDYAVEVRYPDEFYIPTINEAQEAFKSATRVKGFILEKLKIK
ncbi:MAG: HEPN domain-containing protein, partial [candidate division WOR-3 bacterium]